VGRYLIVYRTSPEETVILAVLHGNRDIPAVLRDREAEE
jgi:plasmid stabilization system protein ParE